MPVTIDRTASSRLAAKLELRHPDLTTQEKQEVVASLRKTNPGLAEGLADVWKLD